MELNIYILILIFIIVLMYLQPEFLGNLCNNCFSKAFIILLIVFLAIEDMGLAILASIIIISSMHLVNKDGFKYGFKEGFKEGQEGADDGSEKDAGVILAESITAGDGKNAREDIIIKDLEEANKELEEIEKEWNDKHKEEYNKAQACKAGDGGDPLFRQGTKTEDSCTEWQEKMNEIKNEIDGRRENAQRRVDEANKDLSELENFSNKKEGFMTISPELLEFEDKKIRSKDSNMYPVVSPKKNGTLFSGLKLF